MALSFPKNTKVQASALNTYEIDGQKLTIVQVAEVSYQQSHVAMTTDTVSLEKISSSYNYIQDVAQACQTVYGVTTNFGGMAQKKLDDPDCYANLQTNLLWGLKCGVGTKLPIEHVRAAMLARANSLAKGYSGIRLELIERLLTFLNVNAIPIVYERGSIGASGDLIPLSYVAAAIIGISPDYKVQYNGIEKDAISVITELGLKPLKLHPKEGLALVNGTSFMAGIAANSLYNVEYLFKLILHIHAIIIQALEGNPEPFAEFTHHQKAHPGQLKVSEMMRKLLADSQMINHPKQTSKNLVQDRYSIRCLPQFLGAILDGLTVVKKTN